MSTFNNLVDFISPINTNDIANDLNNINIQQENNFSPFDIAKFKEELYTKSHNKNKEYSNYSENINAYDIASACIMQVLYRIRSQPIQSYANLYLPVYMRSVIGTGIHSFIQDYSDQFTETEVILKVPSLRFSGRLDALIGNNILVEIKSCAYNDYKKIIKSSKPRDADFLQAMTYKHLLENHIDEVKQGKITRENTNLPKLDKYKIDIIQFIYVAHDICAADIESFDEALEMIKKVKNLLNSKRDQFFFMTSNCVHMNTFNVTDYTNYIQSKIQSINYCLTNNTIPHKDDSFIDKSKCYFCIYKQVCTY